MNKVTHKGQVLEFEKCYEFSLDGLNWELGRLDGVYPTSDYPYGRAEGGCFDHIRQSEIPPGTIEEAKTELEKGCLYKIKIDGEIDYAVFDGKVLNFSRYDSYCSAGEVEILAKMVEQPLEGEK